MEMQHFSAGFSIKAKELLNGFRKIKKKLMLMNKEKMTKSRKLMQWCLYSSNQSPTPTKQWDQ